MTIFQVFAICFLGICGLSIVWRLLWLSFSLLHHAFYSKVLRHLIYARVFRLHRRPNPLRIELFAHICHWTLVLVCNAYGPTDLREASLRAGNIAVLHLAPLMASRQLYFVAEISGLSISLVNRLHASLGVMAMIQSIAHLVLLSLHGTRLTSIAWYNIFALVSVCTLVTLPLIRCYAYEVFLRTHLALSVSLIVGLWLHLSPQGRLLRILMIGIITTFGTTTVFQWIRQLCRNLSRELQICRVAHVERSRDALFLELTTSPRWRFRAGQSVFLTLLTMHHASWAQSHPFVITWWHDDETTGRTHVHFMMRARSGWTRRLLDQSHRLRGIHAWLDGPYGSSHSLYNFASVLFVASEAGIFAVLPLLKDLTNRKRHGEARTRRVNVVVEMCEFYSRLAEWMDDVLDESELVHLSININIYTITNTSTLDTYPNASSKKVFHRGRRTNVIFDAVPPMRDHITEELNGPSANLAVAVSASQSLRTSVREAVLGAKSDNLRLIELDFQPAA